MDAVSCTHRLHEELREEGLTLVSELKAGSDYAFIARNASAIIVVFRGTCTFGNVLTDLNYLDSGGKAAERLAEVTGIDLPAGVHLHRGFTESYLNLREELVATLRQSSAAKDCAGHGCHAWHADGGTRHAVVDGGVHESHADALRSVLDVDVNMHDDGARASPPELILTGHSMAGSIAMLAALDLNAITVTDAQCRLHEGCAPRHAWQTPQAYTFAAPRLGNGAFADFFTRTLPRKHWAFQSEFDPVPHIPFAKWGFRHPEGIIKLGEPITEPTSEVAGGGTADGVWQRGGRAMGGALHRARDSGDTVHQLRPRNGDLTSWSTCHDLSAYIGHLLAIAGSTPAAGQPSYCSS